MIAKSKLMVEKMTMITKVVERNFHLSLRMLFGIRFERGMIRCLKQGRNSLRQYIIHILVDISSSSTCGPSLVADTLGI
jgi:hypothetical protein